jgi:BirA family biotin operon repressor/biotin-[acetyl-CoA-carboxylase] ligase
VGERKLAGILVEALADGRHVVGIGCNVNNSVSSAPEELASIVTTLRDLTGVVHERTRLLVALLQHFEARLKQLASEPHQLGRDAHHRCLQIHERLTISVGQQETTGICSGIGDDGALLLDTSTGPQRFYSGVLVKQQPRY